MDVYSAAEFAVEVLQPAQEARVAFDVDVFSDEVGDVGDGGFASYFRLDEHLLGFGLRAAGEGVLFVVCGDGDAVCNQVDFPGVEHVYGLSET